MKTIYLSELQELKNKQFESVEELEAAEAQVSAEIAEKQKAAETKKAKADEVKAAITARLEAEEAARKAKVELYAKYLEDLEALQEPVVEARKVEKVTLEEFCKEYGYFHDTVKIGDTTYTCRYGYREEPKQLPLSSLFNSLFN